jgi:hypothetical protein
MVFPVETEDRTMRNLLMLCQDEVRLLVEGFRKILAISENLLNEEPASKNNSDDLHKIHEETGDIKNTLIKELNEIGGVIVNREDFYRLISTFGDVMDHINAIGIRFLEMQERGWKIPTSAAKGMREISDIAFDSLLKLREAIMSLGFNSEKSVGFTHEIDEIEKLLDSSYVKVEMDVITSGIEFPVILVVKDIITQIESMVDTVRDASDLIRIIAL